MTVPPKMRGFTVDEVTAWWVVCDECSDSELVYGSTADLDALGWAQEHYDENHRPKAPPSDNIDIPNNEGATTP